MFFPLLLASALHGSWRVVLAVLAAVLFCYALAMLPGLLERGTGQEIASLVFYRLAAMGLRGLFLIYVARSLLPAGLAEDYATDEDGSVLLERVEEELAARKGVPVAVILVDPGAEMEAMDAPPGEGVVAHRGARTARRGQPLRGGRKRGGRRRGGECGAARPRRRKLPRRAGHQGRRGDLPARRPFRRRPPDRRRTRARSRFRSRVIQRHSPGRQGRAAAGQHARLTPRFSRSAFQLFPLRPSLRRAPGTVCGGQLTLRRCGEPATAESRAVLKAEHADKRPERAETPGGGFTYR